MSHSVFGAFLQGSIATLTGDFRGDHHHAGPTEYSIADYSTGLEITWPFRITCRMFATSDVASDACPSANW